MFFYERSRNSNISGIEVSRGLEGVFLSQRKYALDIIIVTRIIGCKPDATPLEQTHDITQITLRNDLYSLK